MRRRVIDGARAAAVRCAVPARRLPQLVIVRAILMQPRFDVLVIGAGPAGAATAARLHQHGVRRLLLLDRARFPRDKPCGGGLTGRAGEALAALDLRLDVPYLPSPTARIRFAALSRDIALARPVNVVRRGDFDASLVGQLLGRGVAVHCDRRVVGVAAGRDGVTVQLEGGASLAARVVVGADGVGSLVRKQLQRRRAVPHRLFVHELAQRLPDAAMTYDFTPMRDGLRGYLWLFPLAGGGANVGLMHYPSTAQDGPSLRRLLRDGLARHGIDLPPRGLRGWPVWGFEPRAPVAAPRLLTVGDAAGIDGLTGEGISVALEQGALAGDAIARALVDGDFSFAGYGDALRRSALGGELMLDRWLAARVYQCGAGWQRWLATMLFDDAFLDLYAARVAGVATLADHRLRVARLLGRHWLRQRQRLRRLQRILDGVDDAAADPTAEPQRCGDATAQRA